MSIFYYSKECGSCKNSQELALMKTYCQEKGVDFSERRTIFFDRFEKEAEQISKDQGVELPFFYAVKAKKAVEQKDLTHIEDLKDFIEREKNAS